MPIFISNTDNPYASIKLEVYNGNEENSEVIEEFVPTVQSDYIYSPFINKTNDSNKKKVFFKHV